MLICCRMAGSFGVHSHIPQEFLYSKLFFFFFAVLGFELRWLLYHSTSPFFVLDMVEIGSLELFAWAGFEL
jgi:hypothetical protein